MNEYIDFSNRERAEKALVETWCKFRNALAIEQFTIDNIKAATKETFLHYFNDSFINYNQRQNYTKMANQISTCYAFSRGTILGVNERPPITYKRLLPDKNYINDDNRFSPPGIEWLYLSMGNDLSQAEACCLKELRAKSGDDIALCSFEIDKSIRNRKIVDLTISDNYTFDEINYKLTSKRLDIRSTLETQQRDIKYKEIVADWFTATHTKMMSEQLFLPLKTNNRKLMYAPFQCLAYYFKRQGFKGIIYRSTVYPSGKNLVLFDKHYAHPASDITCYKI